MTRRKVRDHNDAAELLDALDPTLTVGRHMKRHPGRSG